MRARLKESTVEVNQVDMNSVLVNSARRRALEGRAVGKTFLEMIPMSLGKSQGTVAAVRQVEE